MSLGAPAGQDLIVRRTLFDRCSYPALAVGAVVVAVVFGDRSVVFRGDEGMPTEGGFRIVALGVALVLAAEAVIAWRAAIVVVGPMVLVRQLFVWREIRLDRLQRVRADRFALQVRPRVRVQDVEGWPIELGRRGMWERTPMLRLYGYLLEAVRSAAPRQVADAKTVRRLSSAARDG